MIDESTEGGEGRKCGGDNNSDGGDEVPQCQGCNQKAAQFVCAGCGNQWYCSRDCQVIKVALLNIFARFIKILLLGLRMG